MARKRVVEAPSLHSWEDVNDALRQIAEAQIALGEIQSDMQKQILGAQKVAEEQSKPLNDNVAKLEREIKSFVTDHRDEMGKTKSMVLTFGEVGFRLSTSVSLPRAKEKLEEIIRRLKSRQMTDCIVVEEKVSKEALKKYGEDTVNAVGATWKQSDVFGYEVNIAKLEQRATEEGGSRNDSSKDWAQTALHPHAVGDREVAGAAPHGRRPARGCLPRDRQGVHEDADAGRGQHCCPRAAEHEGQCESECAGQAHGHGRRHPHHRAAPEDLRTVRGAGLE